jgi:transposase InsO family protein
VSPARRRDAVTYLCRRHPVSERRACKVVGQHRSTNRYVASSPEFERRLIARMNELAARHPRYGYRRIWSLLRADGFDVNRKRIERLWRLEGHRVPPQRASRQKKALGGVGNASWNLGASRPNQIWSYDFVTDRTADGKALRILNVVDDYTRVCVGFHVARSIGAADVRDQLAEMFAAHGRRHCDVASDQFPQPLATQVLEHHPHLQGSKRPGLFEPKLVKPHPVRLCHRRCADSRAPVCGSRSKKISSARPGSCSTSHFFTAIACRLSRLE